MADILDRSAREPDRVVRYAPGETGVIDVYDPRGLARALVVLVHGGFWRSRYDRLHLRPLAEALAGEGLLVALPEYRRVGDEGGGWPGTFDDIRSIVRSVRRLVGAEGARLTLVGHSAGGHLAVLAAGDETDVDRAVSLAGVLDLAAAIDDGLSDGAAQEFLGEDAAAVATADPMRRPVPECEVILLHGAEDDEVPVSYSEAYAARDARIEFSHLPGGHYELIDPEAEEFSALLAALG
ncbi:MAG TPA: alpha/beta hydrolase [Candidatus Agrococcus pullicola]|uniref:Alpha/beta hydrolase n=1 Tax=Candidatus Agrococcus pullicola TaxID=2838429 RepID=A0A9D1YX35_9MICO|nr:alpha/beta hydrolase [Candidatus Agrococcus pullicola]